MDGGEAYAVCCIREVDAVCDDFLGINGELEKRRRMSRCRYVGKMMKNVLSEEDCCLDSAK